MTILLSCLQSLRSHSIPACDFWRSYFVEGCREAGITPLEVPDVDWAEGAALSGGGQELASWRARTWEKTVAFARKQHEHDGIDFFLGYLYPCQVEQAAVRELQRIGIPCVNFFCDNVREFQRMPKAYAPFDLHWVPEFEALPMYRKAGLPHLHAPMPCWVPRQYRDTPERETYPATFIGSADVLRRDLLGRAISMGADMMVRGRGWDGVATGRGLSANRESWGTFLANQKAFRRDHGMAALAGKVLDRAMPLRPPEIPPGFVGKIVPNEDYFNITREAMLTVGISRVPAPHRSLRWPLSYSRLRDIEAPMLGACYLTEWTEGLDYLYDVGREIETYRTAEELCAKIDHLKRSPERRRSLRELGQKRALNDHSVARSLKKVTACLSGVSP
jgi:hypothetical protein